MEEKKLMVKYTKDEDIYKKLEKLYKYLLIINRIEALNLRENIRRCDGIEYRNLGTMEHNICDILAQRMKRRK